MWYQQARGIAANGSAISSSNPATYDFPQDDQFYAYTDSAGTDGQCLTSGTGGTTSFTVVTATKSQGDNQGTLTINVGDGTRGGDSTW